ncbi:hypothetical protein RIF29_24995 [Crotalaria pallida]|uniref:Uncharacterized protein n=1 Tax=Crotalaria pallida TaxID=3830 RepID=A0AAN9HX34_CROPI
MHPGQPIFVSSNCLPVKALKFEPAGHAYHSAALKLLGVLEDKEGEVDDKKVADEKESSYLPSFDSYSGKSKKKSGSGDKQKDHYALLGLSPLRYLATEDQIRKSYHEINAKLSEKARKEESVRIRVLVDNAYKRDPRILRRKEEEKTEKQRKKQAKHMAKKLQEEEAARIAEEERRRKEEEEKQAAEVALQQKKVYVMLKTQCTLLNICHTQRRRHHESALVIPVSSCILPCI